MVEHMSDEAFLTSTEAGAILGCSGRTVVRMVQAGKLRSATKVNGPKGPYLFRRSDLEQVAAGQSNAEAEQVG